MKLSRKLKMTFVLLAIVPLLVVSTGVFIKGRRIIQERTIHHLNSKNHLRKNLIVSWFEDKNRSLRELARRPLVRQYSEILALTERAADPEWQKVHDNINQDHLVITLQEEKNFLSLFILRAADGKILTSTDEAVEGMYRAKERFFTEGKKHTFIQNAYYSLTREEAVISIGTPIRDMAGDTIAVLAGHVDLAELSEIITLADSPETTEDSYLVNKFNFLITGTRPQPGKILQKVVRSEGIDRALKGEDGVGQYVNYAGDPVIGVYEWMPLFEMAILSEISVDEAFAPVKTFGNVILILSAMAICFAIAVGFILAKAISGPVGKLMSGTARIGRDGLDIRIDVDTKDEFGSLAASFNEMTGKLREKETILRGTLTSLEGQVAERTRELSEKNLILEREIEDRTRAEQALKTSEYYLLNAQRMAMLGSWERDIVTGVLKMSPVIMGIYGFDLDQTISFEDLIPLIHPEDKERFLESTLVAAQSGERFNIDYRIIRGDGETRHVHSEIEYSKNSRGDVVKAFGITQDVSDLRGRELELKEQEERLRKITEGALEGIVISEDGVIVEANPQIAEMLGYTIEELIGESIPEKLTIPEHSERVGNRMKEGYKLVYQHDVLRKDGAVITVEVRGTNTKYRDREVRIASVRDVTDQKKNEEAIRVYAEHLRVLHDIDQIVLTGDNPHVILHRILGEINNCLHSTRICIQVTDDEFSNFQLIASIQEGEIYQEGQQVNCPEHDLLNEHMMDLIIRGEGFIIHDLSQVSDLPSGIGTFIADELRSLLMVPLISEDGLLGILSLWYSEPNRYTEHELDLAGQVANSITIAIQKHRMAEEIQHHAIELENIVTRRTKELRDAYDELESFTYSVTHDLRAPLRAMQGFSQALLEDNWDHLDIAGRDYATHIKDSAQRMDELILDLLAYSRLGRSDLATRSEDIADIVKQALDQEADIILGSKADILLEVTSSDVEVHRSTMVLVVENIVSNAIKFVRPGQKPQIRIWKEMMDNAIRIWFEDDGIGIDPAHNERIFKVFERLHGIESYPGTGIGLSIAKRVLDRIGGGIGVESEIGHGSRFWIEIPQSENHFKE